MSISPLASETQARSLDLSRWSFQPNTDAWLRGALLALAVLGSLLHLRHYLAAPSFWYDEAALLLNITARSYAALLGPLEHLQAAPPLFLWSLRGLYDLFGCNEYSMRFPSLLGGIALVWLAWPWARQNVGPAGVVCVVAWAATSMHGLQHADEVKPYALDAVWTILILFAGCRMLQAEQPLSGMIGLIALGTLGPWLSFPACFALFGVGVVWFAVACYRRNLILGLGVIAYGLLGVLSASLFWHFAGKYQHTGGLTTWWRAMFWDVSSPTAALLWPLERLRHLTDYATTGMGIPFLLSAPLGLWALYRRSPLTLGMIASTVASAFLANALGKYPLDGRLVFFLAPIVWLILAAAFDVSWQWMSNGRWLLFALMVGLTAPDLARSCRATLQVHTNADFREAFAQVDQHWQEGDALLQSGPEVYRVYYGTEAYTSRTCLRWQEIPPLAGRRLWMISQPESIFDNHCTVQQVQAQIEAVGWRKVEEKHFYGVDVVLYVPSAANSGHRP